MPIDFQVTMNGITLRFTEPVDADVANDKSQHFAQAWNYRYSPAYGSAEYSSLHYGTRGHDQLRVASAHVLENGKAVFLELPDLQMCNTLHVQVATAQNVRHDVFVTCNAVTAPRDDVIGVDKGITSKLPHPIELDMAMAARRVANPWRRKIAGAREIKIEAGKNLSYSVRQLRVTAGEPIGLTLSNPDVVPHNWALVQPDTLSRVGNEANRLIGDPEALIRQYVPQSSDVICYTDIVEPQDQATIYFNAPKTPGRYPFLCTFPGHWMVMNGELIVE